ncbi:MAG: hypothetical protein KJZ83_10665 [Burkholderiaceae bacterium]|nr:hypothetical protein [Burkholderiaceae bacterium]
MLFAIERIEADAAVFARGIQGRVSPVASSSAIAVSLPMRRRAAGLRRQARRRAPVPQDARQYAFILCHRSGLRTSAMAGFRRRWR